MHSMVDPTPENFGVPCNFWAIYEINPQPECFGHFGDRIPLLFTTFWGFPNRREFGRYKLPIFNDPLLLQEGAPLVIR